MTTDPYDPGPAYRTLTREESRAWSAAEHAEYVQKGARALALKWAKDAAEYFAAFDVDWDIRVREWAGDKTYVALLAESFEQDLYEYFDIQDPDEAAEAAREAWGGPDWRDEG